LSKSLVTNLTALIAAVSAYLTDQALVFTMAVFALSGAITNWLAIHMLFERVPGLYGSGVIPAHFEAFRLGIRRLIMNEFFSDENIDRFLNRNQRQDGHPKLAAVIEKVDLSPAFESLVTTIMASSFGSMLAMLGGEAALQPLRQPFIDKMRHSLIAITSSDDFSRLLIEELESPGSLENLKQDIKSIIDSRLEELTPQTVKNIIQDMIRQHLGWLVVWGGVFGAPIGLLSAMAGLI